MINVFPTRNIHLVMAYPDAPLDLSLCADWPPDDAAAVWSDLSTTQGIAIRVLRESLGSNAPEPAHITTPTTAGTPSPTGVSLRAANVGSSFYRIVVAAPGVNKQVALFVSTHADVDRLMLPYGDIYMFEGRDDFILTVFARFTDQEMWDVTEHPWLEYGSEHPAVARVEGGRIIAVGSGETMIWAQPIGRPASRVQCKVHVSTIASWTQGPDPNIALGHIRRPAKADRHLHLISDGYVDRTRFERHANEVAERIFAEANAPFRWVRDHFAVTWIYVRSAGSRGIIVAPPVAYSPSTHNIRPREAAAVQLAGNLMYDPGHLNAFGLMYGARLGDVDAPDFPPTAHGLAAATLALAGSRKTRSISVDLRRVGAYRTLGPPVQLHDPRETFERDFTALLHELGVPFEPNDRVAFICDDQMRGGARFSVNGMQPRRNPFVSMTTGAFPDHFDGVQGVPNPLVVRVPSADPYNPDFAATSVVHELGHTYRLGDEYETNSEQLTDDETNRSWCEQYDNIQLRDDVKVNGRVDVSLLKWYVPRAEKVSVIKTITAASASTLVITIDGNPTKIWRQFERVGVRSSFARERPRDANGHVPVTVKRLRDFAYEINDVSDSQIVLFAPDGGAGTDVSGLTILYKPVFEGIDPLYLVDPAVVTYLESSGIFPRNPANCVATDADGIPPAIPNAKLPTAPADLVGIYEGGGEYSCGVIRPSGRCKMRGAASDVSIDADNTVHAEVQEYCFVCKFIIADQIDPAVLPKVLVHYPKQR